MILLMIFKIYLIYQNTRLYFFLQNYLNDSIYYLFNLLILFYFEFMQFILVIFNENFKFKI